MIFALVLVLSLVLIMAGPMATPVQAKESEPKSGQTADVVDSIGTVTWDNVSNALQQDNYYASAILTQANNTTYYLKATNFGFAISSNATIQGIKVEVDRSKSGDQTLEVFDNSIKLVKGGAISGTDRSTGFPWPNSDIGAYAVYGNSTDLWGLEWDPGDINGPDFGVAISAVLDGDDARNAWVDHIRITVYYTIDEYHLTMAVNPPGTGTATDQTGMSPYEVDEPVAIEAVANTGYWFVEWTADPPEASDGFADAELAETIFTMPACNVTVTASFSDEEPLKDPPEVTTVAASGISRYTATLNMDYTRGDYTSVQLRFAYRVHETPPWNYGVWITRIQDGPWHDTLGDLTAGTEYDFQAQLKYDLGQIEGAILQFETDELGSPICFIATAAYGTPSAEQIDVLREFRDSVLLKSTAGSVFVSLYYQLSPPVADFIAGNELLRTLVREFLIDPIVCVVESTGNIWRN